MEIKSFLFYLFLALLTFVNAEWTIDLEYSFNDFTNSYPLGSIDLRRTVNSDYIAGFKGNQDKDFGKKLFEAQNQTYYVRAKSSTQPGQSFLTSSDPCLFVHSKLNHMFWVSIDGEKQMVQTITMFPELVDVRKKDDDSVGLVCNEEMKRNVEGESVRGVVKVGGKGVLPSPDTATFVQKIEKEKRAKQHGAETDNRSFIAKYWMYIVPVVIFVLISNAVNPEGGEGGAGGQ